MLRTTPLRFLPACVPTRFTHVVDLLLRLLRFAFVVDTTSFVRSSLRCVCYISPRLRSTFPRLPCRSRCPAITHPLLRLPLYILIVIHTPVTLTLHSRFLVTLFVVTIYVQSLCCSTSVHTVISDLHTDFTHSTRYLRSFTLTFGVVDLFVVTVDFVHSPVPHTLHHRLTVDLHLLALPFTTRLPRFRTFDLFPLILLIYVVLPFTHGYTGCCNLRCCSRYTLISFVDLFLATVTCLFSRTLLHVCCYSC